MATFIEVIEGSGGKANKWSQNKYLKKNTFGSAGICAPLALKWIKERKMGVPFNKAMKSENARDEVMQLKINQSSDPHNYAGEYLKMFGLYENLNKVFLGEVSIDELMGLVTAMPSYCFVGLSSMGIEKNFSGHAFAIDMIKLRFFDPNYGQANFDSAADLVTGFKRWFRLEYLEFRGSATLCRYL